VKGGSGHGIGNGKKITEYAAITHIPSSRVLVIENRPSSATSRESYSSSFLWRGMEGDEKVQATTTAIVTAVAHALFRQNSEAVI
jgi:hypothetical protein